MRPGSAETSAAVRRHFWLHDSTLGQFGIFTLAPALLAGFLFLGTVADPGASLALALLDPGRDHDPRRDLSSRIVVKETPEQAGFRGGESTESKRRS